MTDYQKKYEIALSYVHEDDNYKISNKEENKVNDRYGYVNRMKTYQGKYMKYLLVIENEVKVCESNESKIHKILKKINLECLHYLVEKLGCSSKYIIETNKNLFIRKNTDYGNSFEDFGFLGIMVRLNDKINRMKSLCNKSKEEVNDESFIDTVQDLYNYTLLGLMYI